MERPHLEFPDRLRRALKLDALPPMVRRIVVAVVGGTLLLIGLAMIVLPGPAVVVVPIALAVLATEFVWARRYIRKAKAIIQSAKNTITGK
jgi:hypothetical protein